jgi:hypothetical protein
VKFAVGFSLFNALRLKRHYFEVTGRTHTINSLAIAKCKLYNTKKRYPDKKFSSLLLNECVICDVKFGEYDKDSPQANNSCGIAV